MKGLQLAVLSAVTQPLVWRALFGKHTPVNQLCFQSKFSGWWNTATEASVPQGNGRAMRLPTQVDYMSITRQLRQHIATGTWKHCAICEHILQVQTEARRIWTIWYSGSAIWIKLLKNLLTELQNWGEKISNWVLEKEKCTLKKKSQDMRRTEKPVQWEAGRQHTTLGQRPGCERGECLSRARPDLGRRRNPRRLTGARLCSGLSNPKKSVPGNATRWDQELKMDGK